MKKIILFIMLLFCVSLIYARPLPEDSSADCDVYVWMDNYSTNAAAMAGLDTVCGDGQYTDSIAGWKVNNGDLYPTATSPKFYSSADISGGIGTVATLEFNIVVGEIPSPYHYMGFFHDEVGPDVIIWFTSAGAIQHSNQDVGATNICTGCLAVGNNWTVKVTLDSVNNEQNTTIQNHSSTPIMSSISYTTDINSDSQLFAQFNDNPTGKFNLTYMMVYNGTVRPQAPLTNPPIPSNLYDVTGAGTNTTSDITPTMNLTTDIPATCNGSTDNVTWFGFTTTGDINHQWTVDVTDPLEIGYPQNITVNCSNEFGSNYATMSYNITDGTDPTIVLNKPDDNAIFTEGINNTFVLNFTVTDNYFTILNCGLYINDVLNQSNISVDNGTLTNWNSSQYNFGSYDWNVSCIDGHGNTNSTQRSFTINDLSSPTYTQRSSNGTPLSTKTGETIWLAVNWTDDNAMSYSWLSIQNESGYYNLTLFDCQGNISCVHNTTYTIESTRGQFWDWKFYGNDSSGNINQTIESAIHVNNTAPTINETPTNQVAQSGQSFSYDLNASDVDFDPITYYLNDTSVFSINSASGDITGTSSESDIGTKTYIFTVGDGFDNTSATFDITVNDSEAPTFANNNSNDTSPKQNEYVNINVTWTEANPAQAWFGNNFSGTWKNDTSRTYTSGQDIGNKSQVTAPLGSYICWQAWANDTTGNIGETLVTCFDMFDEIDPIVSNLVCSGCTAGTNQTTDTTPPITADTNENTDCAISIDNSTWFDCGTTGSTSHTCTVDASDPLSIGYPQNVTIGCNDSSDNVGYGTIALNITELPIVVLSLDSVSADRKYEYGSIVNVSANYTVGDTFCIDLDAPNYGVNYSCGTNEILLSYNIDILRQNKFNNSNIFINLTSSGEAYFNMDDRTEILSVYLNMSGFYTVLTIESESVNNFTNGLSIENFTFIADSNFYRNISIARSANISNSTIDLEGYLSHYNVSGFSHNFYAGGDGIHFVRGIYTNGINFWILGLGDEDNGTVTKYDSEFNIINSFGLNRTFYDITGNGTHLWLITYTGIKNSTGDVVTYDISGNYIKAFTVDTEEFFTAKYNVDSAVEYIDDFTGIAYNGTDLWIMARAYKYLLDWSPVACVYDVDGNSLYNCTASANNDWAGTLDFKDDYYFLNPTIDFELKDEVVRLDSSWNLDTTIALPFSSRSIASNGSYIFTEGDVYGYVFKFDLSGDAYINTSIIDIPNTLIISAMMTSNVSSIWSVNDDGVVTEFDYDGNYVSNPINFTKPTISNNYGSLDFDGVYFWRFNLQDFKITQYDGDWGYLNNFTTEGYSHRGITSNGTNLLLVDSREYVFVYNYTNGTYSSVYTLDSSLDLYGIDYDSYEQVYWLYDDSGKLLKYYSNFTDTGISFDIPSIQNTGVTSDISVANNSLSISSLTNIYIYRFTHPTITIKIDNEIAYQNISEFDNAERIILDPSVISNCMNTCSYPIGDNCICPFNFSSLTAGTLQYSNLNISIENLTTVGYPENITISQHNINYDGRLIDNLLNLTWFEHSSLFYTSKNLTFPREGAITIYANASTGRPQNLTFKLWGFNADSGNEVNVIEYFNNTNDTVNSMNISTAWRQEVVGMYDNFERNESYWTEDAGGDTHCSGDAGYPATDSGGNHYYTSATLSAYKETCYASITNDDTTNYDFDLKDFRKIQLYDYLHLHNFFNRQGQSYALGSKFQIRVVDQTGTILDLYTENMANSGSDSIDQIININYSLINIDLSPDNQTIKIYFNSTKDDGTGSFSNYSYKNSYSTSSLVQNESWYIRFHNEVVISNTAGGIVQSQNKLYYVKASGLWLNKSDNSATYDSNGTTTTTVIASSATGSDFTGIYITANTYEPAGTDIRYDFSDDNGVNWKNADAFINSNQKLVFDDTGTDIIGRYNLSTTNVNKSPILYWVRVEVIPESLEDLYIDFGGVDGIDYSYDYPINSSNSPLNISINMSLLGNYDWLNIPIVISTTKAGLIQLSDFSLITNVNPVILNITNFEDCNLCSVSFNFIGGTLTINDLKVDLLGSWNYTALAHSVDYSINDSQIIEIKYSPFNISYPQYIDAYIPQVYYLTQKNVEPLGQVLKNCNTSTQTKCINGSTPIFSFTSYQYDDPMVIMSKYNYSKGNVCYNTTFNNDVTRNNEVIIDRSYQDLMNMSVSTTERIFSWTNFSCSGGLTYFDDWFCFQSRCEECVNTSFYKDCNEII